MAAPSAAAPLTDSGIFLSTGTDAATTAAVTGRQGAKPGLTNRVVLKGKSQAGITSQIVCYVSNWGPALHGFNVSFEVVVSCQGGSPIQLSINMDMAYLYLGEWQIVPGSQNYCGETNFPFLSCVSRARCFQAGNYYDGYALLFGIDENGVVHQAELYAPPRWVGCPI
jgi:hypothetical protein